jgi:hypothetical protein
MELKVRYYLAFLVLVLNVLNFYTGPERFSKKPKCLAKQSPLKCYHIIYLIFGMLAIVDLVYFGYLEKIGELTTRFPKYWWLALVFFATMFYYTEFKDTFYVNFDCNGKHDLECNVAYECQYYEDNKICDNKYIRKPTAFLSRNIRLIVAVIVLAIYLFTFYIEYYNNWFGADPKLGWVRIVGIPTIIVYIWILYNHRNCDYNLPANWT